MAVRQARRRRAGTGRGLAMWAAGLLCGLLVAAAGQALLLPIGTAVALAGGVALTALGLRRALRPRAVVWQEVSWDQP